MLFFTKSLRLFFSFRWWFCKKVKHVIGQCVTILTINFTITGQVKLGIHAMRLCQISSGSGSNVNIKNDTLMSLLSLLDSSIAFNSIFLRHHIFCIIQILSGRWACFAFFFWSKFLFLGNSFGFRWFIYVASSLLLSAFSV